MECWSAGFGGLRSIINSIPQKFKVRLPQCPKAFKKYFMGCAAKGSPQNDFTFYTPLHPPACVAKAQNPPRRIPAFSSLVGRAAMPKFVN
jgi:hypothetical protein